MGGPVAAKKISLFAAVTAVVVVVGIGGWRWEAIWYWHRLGSRFQALGWNEQGHYEYRHRRTGVVFVLLPGGRFWMGTAAATPGAHKDESPVHEVTLSPFLIAKHEVSQEVWLDVMGRNPSFFQVGARGERLLPNGAFSGNRGGRFPVDTVSWFECLEFCRRTDLALPTEAQWEYACRAGSEGDYGGTGRLDDLGWYRENSGSRADIVGPLEPNAFGIYNMHGSVFEWCRDRYKNTFYAEREAGGPDPVCSFESSPASALRVMRGGSWFSRTDQCRSAYRAASNPERRDPRIGLRPVYEIR